MDNWTREALKKASAHGQSIPMKVVSDSMAPLIKTGDSIELEKITPELAIQSLKRFDIILIQDAHQNLLCHFFWGKNQQTFWTRSLKEPFSNDLPINKESFIGKVKGKKIPLIKKIKIMVFNIFKNSL